jgi:hypothetical protein
MKCHNRIDQVLCYAVDHRLPHNELVFLQQPSFPLRAKDHRMQELLRFVMPIRKSTSSATSARHAER